MELFYYPTHDFGPLMKGLVVGGLGIIHVFVAQFAIGGGWLLCYFQWLAQTNRSPQAQGFLSSYFQFLVLVSFVIGALTGVGMWLTTIQISPRTIGLMVDSFHWIWATEWTFFCLEIAAGYAFYRYGSRLRDRTRTAFLILYSTAAWFSLFWINGILSWQLTPGEWTETGQVWAGFFNPSFWPSLFYRTVVCMTLAALVACVLVNTMTHLAREDRRELIHRAAYFLAPMVLMPVLGIWYLASLQEDSRAWVLGGNITMTMFMNISVAASLLIGLYALAGILIQKLYINGATATLLCALALGATGGGEFVREGIRKPYTIRQTLYSNSITPGELETLRKTGSVTRDPYPLKDAKQYPNDQVRLGMKVYRFQCSICHTIDGMNGLAHLTETWTVTQKRLNIAGLQRTKPFMPPFSGNAEEVEALVQLVTWVQAGRQGEWPLSDDPEAIDQIQAWLDEAGTRPGFESRQRKPSEGLK